MANSEITKTYLQSSRLAPPTPSQTLILGLLGILLSPPYLLLAAANGTPGLHLRRKCLRLVLHLLAGRHGPLGLKMLFGPLFYPLDSTRHFELDFAWRTLGDAPIGKYLDVSSPRLLFALLLLYRKDLEAVLINPDKADLAETESLLRASGFLSRTQLHSTIISETPLQAGTFDLITSLSVVEHIPDDRQAIQRIWELLKPGGRFLLTVPCAARASEQYIDRDEYGLYGKGSGQHVFWQRFYDLDLLKSNIFSVTGRPVQQKIFGERTAGLFLKNAKRKRTERYYPFWREPYMVAQEYCYFDSLDQLPGEGVIALEFKKS